MDTPWVTSVALKPLLTMTLKTRCDPHRLSHRTLIAQGSVTKVVSPEAWAEVQNGCMRTSLEAQAAWKPGLLEVQVTHTAARSCWARKPVARPTEQDVQGRGSTSPSFPIDS